MGARPGKHGGHLDASVGERAPADPSRAGGHALPDIRDSATGAASVGGARAGYLGTANALPLGIGLVLTAVSFHRLQGGADGRLGTAGAWVFALCSVEIVVQCMASIAAGSELVWGPAYPPCTLGSSVGLALIAAGSWRVGLAPRWMLGIWPPLGVIGSWWGIGPIPVLYAAFLLAIGELAARRVAGAGPPRPDHG